MIEFNELVQVKGTSEIKTIGPDSPIGEQAGGEGDNTLFGAEEEEEEKPKRVYKKRGRKPKNQTTEENS